MQNVINTVTEKLEEYAEKYPALIFNNKGYEYLRKEIQNEYKEQIKEIEELLKKCVAGFSKFNNFLYNKDNKLFVRYQSDWNAEVEHQTRGSFIGVNYRQVSDFNIPL